MIALPNLKLVPNSIGFGLSKMMQHATRLKIFTEKSLKMSSDNFFKFPRKIGLLNITMKIVYLSTHLAIVSNNLAFLLIVKTCEVQNI